MKIEHPAETRQTVSAMYSLETSKTSVGLSYRIRSAE